MYYADSDTLKTKVLYTTALCKKISNCNFQQLVNLLKETHTHTNTHTHTQLRQGHMPLRCLANRPGAHLQTKLQPTIHTAYLLTYFINLIS